MSSSEMQDKLNDYSVVVILATPPLSPPLDIWKYEKKCVVVSSLNEGGIEVGKVMRNNIGEVEDGGISACVDASKDEKSKEIFVFNANVSNGEDPKGLDPKFGASPLIKKKKRGRPPLISGNRKPFKKPKVGIPKCFKGFRKSMEID